MDDQPVGTRRAVGDAGTISLGGRVLPSEGQVVVAESELPVRDNSVVSLLLSAAGNMRQVPVSSVTPTGNRGGRGDTRVGRLGGSWS